MSQRAAARKFAVPRATLQFRVGEKFKKVSHRPNPILTKEEEDLLVEWISICCKKKAFHVEN